MILRKIRKKLHPSPCFHLILQEIPPKKLPRSLTMVAWYLAHFECSRAVRLVHDVYDIQLPMFEREKEKAGF